MIVFTRSYLLPVVVLGAVGGSILAQRGGPAPDPPGRAAPRLPELRRSVAFAMRGTPAATRTIADVDVLADGRVAVLDFDASRVAIFGPDGRFERLLALPSGIPPEKTTLPRLVALPDGGLVVADAGEDRFFFYDARLEPEAVVPFGFRTLNLNGLVRHPSGDLYIVALRQETNKLLHRFDAHGRHLASSVDALEVPVHDKVHCSGTVAVDPADETLWLTRFDAPEILHLDPQGNLLGRIAPDLPGFEPPRGHRIGGLIWHGGSVIGSVKISVADGLILNSYVLPDGTRLADAFDRDGSVVQSGIGIDHPVVMSKRVGPGIFVRHFNGDDPRVEVWRRGS